MILLEMGGKSLEEKEEKQKVTKSLMKKDNGLFRLAGEGAAWNWAWAWIELWLGISLAGGGLDFPLFKISEMVVASFMILQSIVWFILCRYW